MMEELTVNIGTILKDQREKLGYSLQDIAQYTRIRKTYLESIENNQLDDLPGQAYVTGFIRVYARYLGLDSNSLLAQLEETGISNKLPTLQTLPVSRKQSRPFSKPLARAGLGTIASGFLVLLILGSAIYLLPPMFQSRESAEIPVSKIVTEQKAEQEQFESAGETSMMKAGGGSSLQEAEPVPVLAEGIPPEPKLLPPVPPGGLSLRMLALVESSLTIYLDDRKPHTYKLHDGLDLTWKIMKKVKVELAEPGVARFWLGGQELDLDAKTTFQLQPAKGITVSP